MRQTARENHRTASLLDVTMLPPGHALRATKFGLLTPIFSSVWMVPSSRRTVVTGPPAGAGAAAGSDSNTDFGILTTPSLATSSLGAADIRQRLVIGKGAL